MADSEEQIQNTYKEILTLEADIEDAIKAFEVRFDKLKQDIQNLKSEISNKTNGKAEPGG